MSIASEVHTNAQTSVLLAPLTITAALSATATTAVTALAGMKYLVVEAIFTYGSGGTTTTAYVQTSFDGGLTWVDIMNFAFTTATASKISAVTTDIAPASQAFAPTDGTLASNTIIQGALGDRLRLKYLSTGTYADSTTLAVYAIARG